MRGFLDSGWVDAEQKYQVQPVHVVGVLQVLRKVEAVHIFVNEAKGVFPCRKHTHKRNHVHALLVKETPRLDLSAKPLWRYRQQTTQYKSDG